jgi:hypothetical protein
MTLQECVKYLTENGYLVGMNNMPYLTRKFYKDLVDKDIGLSVVERPQVQILEAAIKPRKTVHVRGEDVDAAKVNWSLLYSQFIIEAEIPRMGYSGRGSAYQLNLSTKPGKEAFKKVLLEGESYDSLLKKAKQYYTNTQMPVKIENFLVKEIWRNDFDNDRDSFAGGGALG